MAYSYGSGIFLWPISYGNGLFLWPIPMDLHFGLGVWLCVLLLVLFEFCPATPGDLHFWLCVLLLFCLSFARLPPVTFTLGWGVSVVFWYFVRLSFGRLPQLSFTFRFVVCNFFV